MKDRCSWVYDIETLKSCFTYSGLNIDTNEIVQYVIHKDRNDVIELVKHLKTCKGQIGYNNINFDYPIIHYILQNTQWDNTFSAEYLIECIYDKAQSLIEEQNKPQFNAINAIKLSNVLIPQLDLFKLWHFNNKARSQSLKGLEVAMNYPNVMEMPILHDKEDISIEDIESILEYNLNDVLATYEFYKLSLDKIGLRNDLNSKYNLKCINFPDSKIGEQLVLKLYCEATGLNPWDVKKLRSERLKIALKECIFDYIKFETQEFNDLLNSFKEKVITETKGTLEQSVIYKGFKYDFGAGGIHGCIRPDVYLSDSEYIIIDADVASLYPSIAVLNKLYPEHLGEAFCEIYEDILKQRIEAKKSGNMTLSDGFKLSLNSVYGKSNDKFSFLYDPLYTMKTTLNGQFMLAMLCEQLVNQLEDITVLQVNTDGITVKIKRCEIDLYYTICKEWEEYTKLSLEYVEYNKMIIRDVNNYIAVTTKNKIKYKGAFEINKDFHKDNSFKIIPIALSEYFVNNTPIEKTILNHKNIYDFCGRQKFKGQDYGTTSTILNDKLIIEKQQKVTRYYISNKGSSFIKNYQKGTNEVINKGYQVTIFNKYVEKEWKDYDINYKFYIKECLKEIDNILNNQLELKF